MSSSTKRPTDQPVDAPSRRRSRQVRAICKTSASPKNCWQSRLARNDNVIKPIGRDDEPRHVAESTRSLTFQRCKLDGNSRASPPVVACNSYAI